MREIILVHAVRLAAKHGYRNVTRSMVAKAAKVAPGSVSYHFHQMRGLQNAIVAEAIGTNNLAVLAQALVDRHPTALRAPPAQRLEAMQYAAA